MGDKDEIEKNLNGCSAPPGYCLLDLTECTTVQCKSGTFSPGDMICDSYIPLRPPQGCPLCLPAMQSTNPGAVECTFMGTEVSRLNASNSTSSGDHFADYHTAPPNFLLAVYALIPFFVHHMFKV